MLTRIVIFGSLLAVALPPVRQQLTCDPPVWGDEVNSFQSRVEAYVALREELWAGLPRPSAAPSVGEIAAMRKSLASRIKMARRGARQGNLFSAVIAEEIKKSLRRVMDAHTWKVIMDDNPGEQPSQVNDDYREGSPLTTMPPNVLAALPRLPEKDIEYRFVERHLILLDTRAMVVIDRIPYAIVDPDTNANCR